MWISVLYALLEGASAGLGIRRDDLGGTLYPYQANAIPAFVLFDDVPGGAGHVRRVVENLSTVFQTSLERVSQSCCGAETSCYECLRNYHNQSYHEQFQRGLAQ